MEGGESEREVPNINSAFSRPKAGMPKPGFAVLSSLTSTHRACLLCPDPSCGCYYHRFTPVIIGIICLLTSITYSSSLPSLKNQAQYPIPKSLPSLLQGPLCHRALQEQAPV